MTRKFQFQPSNTGDLVAVEVADNENWYFELYQNYSKVGSVVPVIVLNSNDWIEINQEPILVTEDGYQLYYHEKYYVVGETSKVVEVRLSEGTLFNNAVRRFYYRENAEAYIERHKPRYSNEDLDWLLSQINCLSGSEAKRFINSLKEKKND